ncbi:unnamed protein product, partial [Ectocarpus fasciculatus]
HHQLQSPSEGPCPWHPVLRELDEDGVLIPSGRGPPRGSVCVGRPGVVEHQEGRESRGYRHVPPLLLRRGRPETSRKGGGARRRRRREEAGAQRGGRDRRAPDAGFAGLVHHRGGAWGGGGVVGPPRKGADAVH